MKKIKLYKSLRFKIIAGLVSLLTLTMAILFVVQYVYNREKMIRNLQENISPHLTQMINDVLKISMLSKNRGDMRHVLEATKQYPDVKHVFILDRVGRIVVSTNDAETGTTTDLRDPTCQVCHMRSPEALNKTVIYSSAAGEKIFRNVNPIYNRHECFPCHDPQQKITGVLVTDFTLKNIERQLNAELGQNILFLLFAVGVSTLVIGVALNHLVIKKLQHFMEAASLFGRGEFQRTIRFKSDDEIKRLADSFNGMASMLLEKMRMERKYLSQIIEAQETERKRISRELHDEIGQALTAITFNLDMIEKELPETSPTRGRVGEAKSLSHQTITSMRKLSMDLRPTMLDDLGLVPTLRWYVQNFSKRLSIASEFRAIGFEGKLRPEVETALYRAIQEGLNNIAKHAGANRVEIFLEQKESVVSASVRDDGRGFDLERVLHSSSPNRGFGILGMQERVSILGGLIDIRSRPGLGTHIRIDIPYPEQEPDHGEDSRPDC